jgi:OOP family OmpA-OmpF porin
MLNSSHPWPALQAETDFWQTSSLVTGCTCLVMTLDSKSIRFDFDKANIKPEYRDILNRIAGILMTLNDCCLRIYGRHRHADVQFATLTASRRSCPRLLDGAGISPTIMSTKGFGKSDPRVPGDSEQARAANRRVEIGIVDSKIITNGPLVVPK